VWTGFMWFGIGSSIGFFCRNSKEPSDRHKSEEVCEQNITFRDGGFVEW